MSKTELQGEDITLHLALSSVEKMKFCINCRNGIFVSKHKVITLDEEGPLDFLSAPIKIICSNCRTHYTLQTIL